MFFLIVGSRGLLNWKQIVVPESVRFWLRCRWVLTAILAGAIAGCGDSQPVDRSSSDSSAAPGESEADRCEKRMAAAIQRLQPEAMATLSRRDSVVNALNTWLTSCAEKSSAEVQLSEANARLLTPAAQRFATSARFTENDTTFIRDCLLLRGMTASIWKQADIASETGVASDREKVVRLFGEIIRSVALMPAEEGRVPVSPYEVLLTGRGTVEDRIWIFADALRQRQIDAVLLSSDVPATGSGVLDTSDWLVAALLETEILVFDPRRGAPVPAAADTDPLVTQPVGAAELSGHARWKTPVVQLIVQPASLSPRMLMLQSQLPAEQSVVLYEELAGGGSEIRPLLDRVATAGTGLWQTDRITLWGYPEARALAAGALSEEQQQAWSLLMRPYDAPFERDPLKSDELLQDPGATEEELSEELKMERRMKMLQERVERISQSSEELFGRASKRLLKVRLEQVMGATDVGMIQQLQQIRIASMQDFIEVNIPVGDNKEALVPFQLPEVIRSIHRRATGDAMFWTSICQLGRGEHGAAVTTLRNYRRQYPGDKWTFASLYNEAIALIRLGDLTGARSPLLAADVAENPEQLQVQWVLSRLPADSPSAVSADKAPETSTTKPPTPDQPTPDQPTPDQPTPDQPTPDQPTPDQPTPDQPTPDQPAPDQPANETPAEIPGPTAR